MATKFDEITYSVILKHGLIPKEKLDKAIAEVRSQGGVSLLSYLTKSHSLNENDVMKYIAAEFKLEYVNVKAAEKDKSVSQAVPYKFAYYYKFLPLRIEKRVLTVAVAVPLDIKAQDELRLHFGFEIKQVIASEQDIEEELKILYGVGADTFDKMLSASTAATALPQQPLHEEVQDIDKLAEDASVIKLVNQIIFDAYKKRATDIHIEPYRNEVKLRYRIDGILYDAPVAAQIKQFLMPILSRIKIMSNLNIVEHRLPQDGRAIVKTQEQILDLRISFIPTPYGESVVIRILPTSMAFGLERLGLGEEHLAIFEQLIGRPHGVVFVTGPTGSGKTTSLYACLSKINKKERKIITIEDPIEYEIPGVVQIQVSPDIGLTFARGLRSILRHDPDVIMVGEVRDQETAEIAIRVALTGHLIFSTLHTNDAASGITRLIDIGVEPYLVASSIEAFIAQRLVRTICPHCKNEDTKQPPEIKVMIARELGYDASEPITLYRGMGCDECNHTGYWGRSGIFEILIMNDELRELILKKPPAKIIKRMACAVGMKTLRIDGWRKVLAGLTTPEEIIRVTQEERYEERGGEPVVPAVILPVPSDQETVRRESAPHEKRLFIRLDAKIPIHWKIYPNDKLKEKQVAPEFLAMSRNIGAGGLCFSVDKPLIFSVGSILELKIDLPSGVAITCLARVVRIEESDEEKSYYIAVCFLDLSGADRAQLNKFVIEQDKNAV
jgi:type II secretory ATPase GspE/PulE/Tfp pilus assembly ATPase PilB-like protein